MGILIVGALHHDVIANAPRLPELDETLKGDSVTYALGGKGGNQVSAAAALHVSSSAKDRATITPNDVFKLMGTSHANGY
jgi:ribokinase